MMDDMAFYEPPAVGIALFSDPDNPKKGVASIAGKAGAVFTTAGDLDTDVLWVTNLSFKQALASRLLKTPRFKTSDFFRVDLSRIALELGLHFNEERLQSAEILSGIADRTARSAALMYDFEKIQENLKRTIEPTLFREPEELATPVFQQALKNSYKTYQLCHDVQPEDGKPYVMRFNRVWFAKKILSFPVPYGAWRHTKLTKQVKNDGIIRGPHSNAYLFLTELIQNYPAMVRMSVKNADPAIANYIDFAIGTDDRVWVPAHEAAQVAYYANVTIKDVILAERYSHEGESLGISLGALDNIQGTSISYGLLAENHLHAVYSQRKQMVNGSSTWVTPARATWWRAWDRVLCLKAAIKLGQKGFFVRGYGTGAIRTIVNDDNIDALRQEAATLGLTSPLKNSDSELVIMGDEEKEQSVEGARYVDKL